MTGNQPGDMYTQPPLPAGETFLGCAPRPPGRLRIGGPCSTRSRARPCTRTAWPPTRTPAGCWPAWGTRSRTWPCRSARTRCPRSRRSGTRWPRWRRSTRPARTACCRSPRTCASGASRPPASDLVFAQAYLQFVVRQALAVLNAYDALLMPTLASPPVPVGYFEEVAPPENFERQKAFTPFTALFNVSAARREPAPALEQGRPADRRDAGRSYGGRKDVDLTVRAAGGRPAVAGPPSRPVVSLIRDDPGTTAPRDRAGGCSAWRSRCWPAPPCSACWRPATARCPRWARPWTPAAGSGPRPAAPSCRIPRRCTCPAWSTRSRCRSPATACPRSGRRAATTCSWPSATCRPGSGWPRWTWNGGSARAGWPSSRARPRSARTGSSCASAWSAPPSGNGRSCPGPARPPRPCSPSPGGSTTTWPRSAATGSGRRCSRWPACTPAPGRRWTAWSSRGI